MFFYDLTWNNELIFEVPGEFGLGLSIHNALKKDPENKNLIN